MIPAYTQTLESLIGSYLDYLNDAVHQEIHEPNSVEESDFKAIGTWLRRLTTEAGLVDLAREGLLIGFIEKNERIYEANETSEGCFLYFTYKGKHFGRVHSFDIKG